MSNDETKAPAKESKRPNSKAKPKAKATATAKTKAKATSKTMSSKATADIHEPAGDEPTVSKATAKRKPKAKASKVPESEGAEAMGKKAYKPRGSTEGMTPEQIAKKAALSRKSVAYHAAKARAKKEGKSDEDVIAAAKQVA